MSKQNDPEHKAKVIKALTESTGDYYVAIGESDGLIVAVNASHDFMREVAKDVTSAVAQVEGSIEVDVETETGNEEIPRNLIVLALSRIAPDKRNVSGIAEHLAEFAEFERADPNSLLNTHPEIFARKTAQLGKQLLGLIAENNKEVLNDGYANESNPLSASTVQKVIAAVSYVYGGVTEETLDSYLKSIRQRVIARPNSSYHKNPAKFTESEAQLRKQVLQAVSEGVTSEVEGIPDSMIELTLNLIPEDERNEAGVDALVGQFEAFTGPDATSKAYNQQMKRQLMSKINSKQPA